MARSAQLAITNVIVEGDTKCYLLHTCQHYRIDIALMVRVLKRFCKISIVQFGNEVDGYTVRSFQLNPFGS